MSDRTDDELARAAEDEAAAAEARAGAARARAEELRRTLQTEQTSAAEPEIRTGDDGFDEPAAAASRPRLAPPLQSIAAAAAALLTVALLVATGAMIWQHRQVGQERQRTAEYAAAARQGVINLMSIDYATAQDSVQRVLDGSTGRFRDNFAETADDFVAALQDEKIVTTATVNDAAVKSMTADGAVVLVSATSRREGKQAPEDQQQPRLWRITMNLVRDGDQIKMSSVEFV
jgi:Mce-associated membrane protein